MNATRLVCGTLTSTFPATFRYVGPSRNTGTETTIMAEDIYHDPEDGETWIVGRRILKSGNLGQRVQVCAPRRMWNELVG